MSKTFKTKLFNANYKEVKVNWNKIGQIAYKDGYICCLQKYMLKK